MPAGEMRERIRFERRREAGDDGYGNVQYEWQPIAGLGPVAARIEATSGSEDIISDRLSAIDTVDITIRSSRAVEALTSEDRCINVRSARIYNIRSITNPDERRRYLLLLCDSGVAT